ncbi:hypothetical protein GJ496_011972 [Pomphorhynchus laevis]|nr:hypothetical protein GJ496_011972 [Pomphorhynchus laevis]
MRSDEKVDLYLADLTRLFGIITTVHNEDFLKYTFVNGLPASVKSQLITSSNFSDMQLCDIVVKARSMLECQLDDQPQLYYTKSIRTTYHRSRDYPTKPIRRCYNCGSRDHLANPFACKETVEVDIQVQGSAVIKTSCLSVDMDIPFDALVGMDIINRLGGIQISQGSLKFLGDAAVVHHVSASHVSSKRQMPSVSIRDDDFSAIFDGNLCIASYIIDPDLQQDFEKEVNCWIREGWLIPYDGEVRALILLMTVMQANKSIVRPALNFRELNGFVTSNTSYADACVDKIRSWRRKGKRDNKPLDSEVPIIKRQLFSFCRKVIGHFPVCRWLRPSCSYLKRLCNDIGWDDPIPENIMKLI